MECLRDYIGIRGCGTTVPPSGIYITDLAGVSLKQISSLADQQQATFAGVWADVQTRALLRLADDFRAGMGQRYKLNRALDSISLPKRNLDLTATAEAVNATDFVGVTIDLDYGFNTDDKEFVTSPLSAVYLQEIWVYIDASAAGDVVDVTVVDMDTLETLTTKTFTAVAGWNQVRIDAIYTNDYYDKTRKLFVGYGITTDNGVLTPPVLDCSKVREAGCYCEMRLRGATLTDADVLTEGDNAFGVAPIVSVRCDYASFICTNADLFKRTLLYCLGVELMNEQLYTDRLNEYSLIRRTQAQELIEKYTADYNASLKQITTTVDLGCDCCLECGGNSNPYLIEQTP